MSHTHMMAQTSFGKDSGNATFRTTHWTVVLDAARPGVDGTLEAFAQIYLDYWYPLYAYVRRRGYSPPDAEDITQDFFLHLIEQHSLAGLEREGAKFRSFLLRSLDNFLANKWDRTRAQKRGAGLQPLSLNITDGEARFSMETSATETPETLFERQWIFTLLARVLEYLSAECETAGRGRLFHDLRLHLQGERQGPPYAEVAARHGMNEGAVKVAVHRLKKRYGELLREEIARTVGSPAEVDDELNEESHENFCVTSGRFFFVNR
jgi:RNA polymerase sigma factor (sigma-70 family)